LKIFESSLQSHLFRVTVHATYDWLKTLISDPAEGFDACSTYIWRRRRFWCCWCIFLSCNLLHNLWIYEDFEWMLEFENLFLLQTILQKPIEGGEEGQAQQFIVRATFSLFSRPSHLGILVLRILCVLKFPILEDKTIFKNLATLGHKIWID